VNGIPGGEQLERHGRGRIVVEGVDLTAVKGYADEIGDAARKRLSEARHA
jgi:hypothetical protein